MSDPLKPSVALLVKLGSVIIHQEEKASAKGHYMDQFALDTVRNDPDVVQWIGQMQARGFLPLKR